MGAQLVRGRGEVKGEEEFGGGWGGRGERRERGLKCGKRGRGDVINSAVNVMSNKEGIIPR